jgi:hypothetical protein
MRFVSTALVMMTIALMLLALMLLGPDAHAKSDQTTGIEMPHIVVTALPDRVALVEL